MAVYARNLLAPTDKNFFCQCLLALLNFHVGDYDIAKPLLIEAKAICVPVLGPKHSKTQIVQSLLIFDFPSACGRAVHSWLLEVHDRLADTST